METEATGSLSVNKRTPFVSRRRSMETPVGLRRIGDSEEVGEFSGFKEERGSMRRIVNLEKELRAVKETIANILENQNVLIEENCELKSECEKYGNAIKENSKMKQCLKEIKEENEELKKRCAKESSEWKQTYEDYEKLLEANKEMKESLEKVKEENRILKEKCNVNEVTLQKMDGKVKESAEGIKKIEEKQKEWKIESETVKESFRDIVSEQMKEKARDSLVKVIKENGNLVRETVDKKKCVLIFGMKEDNIPHRLQREKTEKENIKKIMKEVKSDDSNLENEIEEHKRLGKYEEGKRRPVKIKFRSQLDVEEALAGANKLAKTETFKNIWIKKDLNEEERARINELWTEAKAKNEERTEAQKKVFYWKVIDMKVRKWYIKPRVEGGDS